MDYPSFNEIVRDLSTAQVVSNHPISIEQSVISKICSVKEQKVSTYEKAMEFIFDGKTLLFIEGIEDGYVLNLEKEKMRT
ncbi:spore germination protein [Peribacillus butanolivorans]|uniref:spore germination protein n=1 Tax=Peribacillus butanolivorans TaxID=421767 RepID=UPI0020D21329|nr:spore germination protein [Peribacillus butanolivorans]